MTLDERSPSVLLWVLEARFGQGHRAMAEKQPPKVVWKTLFFRALDTFRAYQKGPFRDYFLSKDYVDSLAEQKNLQVRKLNKIALLTYGGLLFLVFFPDLGQIKTPVLEIEPANIALSEEIIQLAVSLLFHRLILVGLDLFAIVMCLNFIFLELNMFSAPYFYMHISPDSIWVDALQQKHYGPKSSLGHKLIAYLANTVLFSITAVATILPAAIVFYFAVGGLTENFFTASWFLDAASIFIVSGSLMIVVLVLLVPVKFREGFLLEGQLEDETIDLDAAARILGTEESGEPNAE